MKKTFTKLLPLALTMAMLSGCGGQASPSPSTAATSAAVSETPAQTEAAASSEASSEAGTRTVTDMAGRKVELSVDTMEKRFLIFPQRERQVLKINQILRNHLPIL